MGVTHSLLCQLIQMRRDCMRIAVAAQMRTDILGRQPENIRPLGRLHRKRPRYCKESKESHRPIVRMAPDLSPKIIAPAYCCNMRCVTLTLTSKNECTKKPPKKSAVCNFDFLQIVEGYSHSITKGKLRTFVWRIHLSKYISPPLFR